jgi:hypothetical protein
MKKAVYIGMLMLLSSCSKKIIYLNSWGTVTKIGKEYIEVTFNCENVKRPDCQAIGRYSRHELGDVTLFQRINLCP